MSGEINARIADIPVIKENKSIVSAEQLIARGMETGLSIEGMKELLSMRKELKEEAAKEEFFKSLPKFQSECPTIEKKKIVYDRGGKELYRYAPIEDIISQVSGALKNNGFSYTFKMQAMTADSKYLTVVCELHHSSGHTESTEISVPIGSGGIMSGVQQIGSATTYAKRYSFCNVTGISTGDQDTDAVPEKPEEPKKEAKLSGSKVLTTLLHNIAVAKSAADIDTNKQRAEKYSWTEEESLRIHDAITTKLQMLTEAK